MKTKEETNKNKYVMILDKHRGVYAGELVRQFEDGNAVELTKMRHALYFKCSSESKGVYGLAVDGPQDGSQLGPEVSCIIRDVQKIVNVTEKAEKQWRKLKW